MKKVSITEVDEIHGVFSSSQTADILGVTPQTIRRWVREGIIECYRFPYEYKFDLVHIKRFLSDRELSI